VPCDGLAHVVALALVVNIACVILFITLLLLSTLWFELSSGGLSCHRLRALSPSVPEGDFFCESFEPEEVCVTRDVLTCEWAQGAKW
jgi:hypothetical protein